MPVSCRRAICTLLILPLSTTAVGQPGNSADNDAEGDIEELVVTASRVDQPASAIAGTVTVLNSETIERQAAISDDLASVLSHTVPGFAPGLQKLTGRGETLRGRNPLYLIDGVPQHNALRDGQRDGHNIDLDFIERIEVINGSNAIQGVGATGGVVQSITRSPRTTDRWETTIRTRLSSPDATETDGLGYKASVLTGRKFAALDVVAGVAWHERGLFYDSRNNPVGLYPTQGDVMDSASRDLFLKTDWHVTDTAMLTLLANDFDLERHGDFRTVPGDRANNIPTGTVKGDPSGEVGDPARNQVTTVSLTWRQSELAGGDLVAQVYEQSFDALFEGGTFDGFFRLTPDGEPFLDQSAIVSDKNGVKLTYSRAIADSGVVATAGLDYFRDDSAQALARSGRNWVPETRFETWSPFLQLNWDASERISVSGGMRREDARLEVDDFTTIASAGSTSVSGGAPSFIETLGNAGVIYRFSDRWRAYASFSEGFTMPDVGRVLRAVATPGTDVDSLLTLEPIVTDNREVGLEFDKERVSARLAYFESIADNGSRLQTNAAGIFEVERQRTEIDGYELSIDYFINDAWRIGGNYSATDGRLDSDGDSITDSDLDGLNIGPDRLNLHVEGALRPKLRLLLQASHLEDRNFSGPAAPTGSNFDGYVVVDLHLGWDSELGRFGLAVDNLLNEEYITYFSQTEPGAADDSYFAGRGRTLTLSWQQSF